MPECQRRAGDPTFITFDFIGYWKYLLSVYQNFKKLKPIKRTFKE